MWRAKIIRHYLPADHRAKEPPMTQPARFLRMLLVAILLGCALLSSPEAADAEEAAKKVVRVLVWDEQQPAQKEAYENFLGNAIAEHLKAKPEFRVLSTNLDAADQGLDNATLDATDVIIWWGHVRHADVKADRVKEIVERVKRGQLQFIALHSAHFAEPFMQLMWERAKEEAVAEQAKLTPITKIDLGSPPKRAMLQEGAKLTPRIETTAAGPVLVPPGCIFPAWRNDGAKSTVTTLAADHPIAQGLPKTFEIPKTEMYSEPFHVPTPEAVVFEERWEKGEHFRSGYVWKVGQGKVFYYRPGHETYPIFKQAENLLIIENAVRWMGTGN